MLHTVSLFIGLAGAWLLMSGHYDAMILTFGAISCVFVTLLARRMDILDHESHPLHMGWRLPGYWVWLLIEIIRANIDVARRIIDPKMPIEPHLFEIPMTQKTDLGRVIFANSITLTPGTVSLDIGNDTILVHALTQAGEDGLATGEMDAKVTELER